MNNIRLIFFNLVTLFLLFAGPLHAQFKIGVTGGLNISQLTVSDDDYKDYVSKIRPGFLFGLTAVYTHDKTGLGVDVSSLYDLRGAKSKTLPSETIYCKSIQFPVNVRYGKNFQDMIYAFLFTGPQFGLNLGSKERLIMEGTGKTTGHAMERRWVSEETSFSWNFGIGGIVMENFQVRISYNLALKKTGEIQQVDLVEGTSRVLTEGKASACQINFSYLF